MRSMKLIQIEWLDSSQPISPWQWLSDFEPSAPVKCVSVGFLVHESDSVKVLAQNVGDWDKEESQISGVIHIPTCAIVSEYVVASTNLFGVIEQNSDEDEQAEAAVD